MLRIRSACSRAGMVRAWNSAEAVCSMWYGLTMRASCSSWAAPVNWLRTRTPRSSSRAEMYSLATRFMPSCRLVTMQASAAR